MGKRTLIQWCDSTVNPTMGCDGCELWDDRRRSCYAGQLHRVRGKTNKGFAPAFEQVTCFPGRMSEAAGWRCLQGATRPDKPWLGSSPRMIFVSDMGDSLSDDVTFEYLKAEVIDTVSGPRGARHEWLWLTKRPARMVEFGRWLRDLGIAGPANLWAGTSITTQGTLARARTLLRVGDEHTTRFLSVEPQIEEIDFGDLLPKYQWIIQGGESGSGARRFDLAWARSLRNRCRAARTPYFLKQLGAQVTENDLLVDLRDGHGGDWDEWPADLRVRELPIRALEAP